MYVQAQELVLKSVSIDTIYPQQIKLTWLFEDIDSVSIYKCVNQCNDENYYSRFAKVNMDIVNLEWTDTIANPASLNYFSIGWTFSGKSAPLNNMVLSANVPIDGCLNSALLSWNPYINMMDSLDYYKIFCRTKMDTTFVLLDSIKGEHISGFYFAPAKKISYNAICLANNTTYEFVIQAVNKSNTEFSFSNIVIYKTGFEDDTPVPVEISCVSVIEDTYIQIDVTTGPFVNPFQKLYLLRDDSATSVLPKESLQFLIIDSMDYNPTNQYRFVDERVAPNPRLYYYRAIADNSCKLNDSSNIKTNIYLYGDRTERFLDSIQFVQIGFPEIDIDSYELLRLVYNTEIHITDNLRRNTSYFIDVEPFIDDGAVIQYKIKSKQGCYSNSFTIAHEPIVDFPNAFYPQSKNLENQTFYPILRFPSEDNYLFIIYNRWGQEFYRSILPPVFGDYLNMQGRWDGTFQGKDCPPGVYAYKLSYTYNEGKKKYSDSGTFMLVR
jgi:hypothetical protein